MMTLPSVDQSSPLRPGARLGVYEVTRLLARGGMAEVYAGRDTRLHRNVAIKVLPARYGGDADRLRRFEQEIRATSRLSHPNVVSVYDVGELGSLPYFVTEILDGETLRSRLDRGSLPLAKALTVAAQIAEGLAAAHALRIVHRDLKPANIFITRTGHIKVLDFGLAKLLRPDRERADDEDETISGVSDTGQIVGTAGYMAPEQVHGAEADHRADIFALGAILYEMLSGRRAFDGESAIETMHAILKDEPEPLADVPEPIVRLIARCLAKSPAERFQSVADLLFSLREAEDASLTRRHHGRGNRTVLILGATIALITGATLFLPALRFSRRGAPRDERKWLATPLTSEMPDADGRVLMTADRRFLIYTPADTPGKTIRLRQVSTGSEVDLLQPEAINRIFALSLSPDGNYVYYVRRPLPTTVDPSCELRRVPLLGGPSKTILRSPGLIDGYAISPNGRRVAWADLAGVEGKAVVTVTTIDGGTRRIASLEGNFRLLLAWSPDGRVLAAAPTSAQRSFDLAWIDVASGEVIPKLTHGDALSSLEWIPQTSHLVAAVDVPDRGRILRVSYPTGSVQEIDRGRPYESAWPIGRDTFVATLGVYRSTLWMYDLQTKSAALISTGRTVDGARGIGWVNSDRIVFTSEASIDTEQSSLWTAYADGSERRRLTHPPEGFGHTFPAASPDGKYVVFVESRGEITRIMRVSAGGSSPVALASGTGYFRPKVTPDGRSVIFDAEDPPSATALQVPINGGALVKRATDCSFNDIDRQGAWLACCSGPDEALRESKRPIHGERPAWVGHLDAGFPMQFTPSGDGLAFVPRVWVKRTNMFVQRFDSATPTPLTDFRSDMIASFAFSPDGQRIALARLGTYRDAVLLTRAPAENSP
jgi:eukaryotic-like serine/threonine-protein kinase